MPTSTPYESSGTLGSVGPARPGQGATSLPRRGGQGRGQRRRNGYAAPRSPTGGAGPGGARLVRRRVGGGASGREGMTAAALVTTMTAIPIHIRAGPNSRGAMPTSAARTRWTLMNTPKSGRGRAGARSRRPRRSTGSSTPAETAYPSAVGFGRPAAADQDEHGQVGPGRRAGSRPPAPGPGGRAPATRLSTM